jgi:predicted MFS family arabinose efflux permease
MRKILRVGFGRDVYLLIASMSVVSLTGAFATVVQPIYLVMLGFSPVLIGLIVSVSQIMGTVRMVLLSILADRVGRRKILFITFLMPVLYNLIYFFARDYPFFLFAAIVSAPGGEGLSGSIGGALLAEKTGDARRTRAFSTQFFVASSFAALGSFLSALPEVIAASFGVGILDAIRVVFASQAVLALGASLLILLISEDEHRLSDIEERYLSKESRLKVMKFSFIGLFDGFGVGMFRTLFSLWFYLRFGIDIKTIGYIDTISRVCETVTYLFGPPLAAKLGLVRTVSITRFGGALSVGLMAFMPTYPLATIMYVSRNAIQHISIPIRQSYVMAIFNRNERASAASLSTIVRTAGRTTATTVSGHVMEHIGTTLPPIVSSILVGFASLLYYLLFRHTKPPEEEPLT